jgi:hypothetical protein
MSTEATSREVKTTPPEEPEDRQQVFIVSYPKIVFLYPTFLLSLLAGIVLSFAMGAQPDPGDNVEVAVSLAFLIIAGTNLVVLAFDFPRTTSLTLFFVAMSLVLGAVLLFTLKPELLPSLTGIFSVLRPVANPTFYFILAGMLGLIYVGVLITVRFDYWEVRPNELLHHHGLLSDLERFAAPNMRIQKEIPDIFEYFLLRSGRLVLTPQDAVRPIVLENVLFISNKEAALTRMLGALQVQVRQG